MGNDAGTTKELKILVADDEEIVHWGLRFLLESQSWVEHYFPAFTHAQAVARANRIQPHLVIVDAGLIGGGLITADAVRRSLPGARVLLLTEDESTIAKAKLMGLTGAASKRTPGVRLIEIIRLVASGRPVFPTGGRNAYLTKLSDREREVLYAVARGSTNREIADRLQLSPETVKHHAHAVYRKLGVRNRTEAARMCDDASVDAEQSQDMAG